MTATSHQRPAEPSAAWRAKVKAGADFCKRDPAAWSASVRYEDQLVRDGVDPDEARRLAVEHFDRARPGAPSDDCTGSP